MSLTERAVDVVANVATGSAEQGPPSDLPEPVPDFVGDILASVDDFVAGAADELGKVISDIASSAAGEGITIVVDVVAVGPF